MATNGTNGTKGTNGANGVKDKQHRFDPNFTDHVIGLMSEDTKPRHREILSSLIRHLHDFCRDVELTQDEWIIGVNYVNSIGQAFRKNRNEAWRVCDYLGIES
jgi:catechol 1,2-dioxygenase